MRQWVATVEDDYGRMQFAIRLAQRVGEDRIAVAVEAPEGGDVVMREQGTYEIAPPILRLPREAVEALRDALNGHMPPRDDRDLREALRVERDRVDRILDRSTPMTEPYARVTRAGRWLWMVVIVDGLSLYGPNGYGWLVLGRKRACRRASAELDRYLVRRAREAESFVVEAP